MKEFIYCKGDVFLADLGVPHGSEQGGRRPVVIIQNDDGCVYSPTVTMVPMTTAIKKPFQKSHYILRYSDCIRYRSMVEAEQNRSRPLTRTALSGGSVIWIQEIYPESKKP